VPLSSDERYAQEDPPKDDELLEQDQKDNRGQLPAPEPWFRR